MAISSYYDVYTVPEYQVRVSDIQSSIANLKGGSFFTEAKQKVLEQIKALQVKEAQFLSKINIPGVKTLADLNQHLAEYKKVVLNLSGPALFQSFTGILEEKNAKEFEFFNNEVSSIIRNEILNNKEVEERSIQWAHAQVMQFLNQGLASSKGINTSYHSTKGFTDQGIFPSGFTNAQKNRWKKIIAQRMKSKGIGNGQWDVDAFTNSATSMTVSFNWFETTKQLTQTEAKNLPQEEIDRINLRIKEAIISQTNDRGLISNIVDHVLGQNTYAFFVGKNTKDITGVLGEIQGLYYLSKLFGGANATTMPPNISWRGGTYKGENSTKPHQDLLFENFGIQVKNSTKEMIGSINFANASIETMIAKTGMSEEAGNVFYNFYGTKEFNVPYHREGNGEYLPGLRMSDNGAAAFDVARQSLLQCEKDIEALLNLFAASFMYMDIAEDFSLQDANTLYLIGGTAFYSAASILAEMLTKLEAEVNSLHVTSSITLGRNIIDALNSGMNSYSTTVIKNIKLTSSYQF